MIWSVKWERLEVVGPWSGSEDGSVDPKRKMGHKSARAKNAYEESEKPKEAEMEVYHAVPQEASVEIQSRKRNVVRVETDETHDYVRETLAISQEDAEEVGFVPSALGEPREVTYWCDHRCSEKAIRHWQIASIVVEEGGLHNQFVSMVLQ